MLDESTGVSLGLVVAFIAALLPVGAGFVAIWFRIDHRFAQQSKSREDALRTEREAREKLDDKLDDLRDRMNREFVSHLTLQRTEDRLILAIEKLDSRLAEVVTKVDDALTRFASRLTDGMK